MQVHTLSLAGGESRQLTSLPVDVEHLWWFPNGKLCIAANVILGPVADVPVVVDDEHPFDCFAYTEKVEKAIAASKLSCRVFTELPVRNWDDWCDERRMHVFELPLKALSNGQFELSGAPVDLMPGFTSHCPHPVFRGTEDVSMSSTHIAFSARPDDAKDAAWSTNKHIYIAPLDNLHQRTILTLDNPGYDHEAAFSPDGTKLAWYWLHFDVR